MRTFLAAVEEASGWVVGVIAGVIVLSWTLLRPDAKDDPPPPIPDPGEWRGDVLRRLDKRKE